MSYDEKRHMVNVIARLLDHAVSDFEKSDECIAAVDAALEILRQYPNEDTISAMMEARK